MSPKQTFLTGEPVKTTRFCNLLFALLISASFCGVAQSNAKSDYKSQHKDAEKYQKYLLKQRQKQEKQQAKVAQAYRKQHKNQ